MNHNNNIIVIIIGVCMSLVCNCDVIKFLLLESLQKKIMIISQNNYQTYNYMY